jgi:hypothetical protein
VQCRAISAHNPPHNPAKTTPGFQPFYVAACFELPKIQKHARLALCLRMFMQVGYTQRDVADNILPEPACIAAVTDYLQTIATGNITKRIKRL